jgi:hypothetical protein
MFYIKLRTYRVVFIAQDEFSGAFVKPFPFSFGEVSRFFP